MNTNTFIVMVSSAVYHHSTDGYLGQHHSPYSFCASLEKAVEVLHEVGYEHEVTDGDDETWFYIKSRRSDGAINLYPYAPATSTVSNTDQYPF